MRHALDPGIESTKAHLDMLRNQKAGFVNRVTPIMGGVEDHTHPTDSTRRLVIEGTVLMGGLDIKN
jgi:hypothetical protein